MTDLRDLAARCNDIAIAAFRQRMRITGADPGAAGSRWRPEDIEVEHLLREKLKPNVIDLSEPGVPRRLYDDLQRDRDKWKRMAEHEFNARKVLEGGGQAEKAQPSADETEGTSVALTPGSDDSAGTSPQPVAPAAPDPHTEAKRYARRVMDEANRRHEAGERLTFRGCMYETLMDLYLGGERAIGHDSSEGERQGASDTPEQPAAPGPPIYGATWKPDETAKAEHEQVRGVFNEAIQSTCGPDTHEFDGRGGGKYCTHEERRSYGFQWCGRPADDPIHKVETARTNANEVTFARHEFVPGGRSLMSVPPIPLCDVCGVERDAACHDVPQVTNYDLSALSGDDTTRTQSTDDDSQDVSLERERYLLAYENVQLREQLMVANHQIDEARAERDKLREALSRKPGYNAMDGSWVRLDDDVIEQVVERCWEYSDDDIGNGVRQALRDLR